MQLDEASQSSHATPSVVPTLSAIPTFTTIPTATQTPTMTPIPTPIDYCIDLPIVLYHHIQPMPIADLLGHGQLTVDSDIFDGQVKYLKDHGYNAISADELVNSLLSHKALPPKSIMLTVDDGYDDNYTYAFLTAKKYKMIVNFMVPTGLINTPGYMNWDHLTEMAHSPYARIYNHTTSHAALGALSKEQIIQEVSNADNELLKRIGVKSTIVTYPYGSYNDLAIQTLKEMGERAAITTEPGRTQCVSTIMRLPRIRVANGTMDSYGF
jgi:peptidoglycan/xylan/chitin deacetylase (PgdA/CDA1 family)